MKKVQLQTMSIAFRQICEGERDWTALGNFMNYWYSYAKDRRPELMTDPLPEYDTQSLYQHRWAVFCAASVEWFCDTYTVPCPSWVHDPRYTALADPWYFYEHEEAKSILRRTTPKQFTKRNIFCGDNCYANKWELAEYVRHRRAAQSPPQIATL
ncbi:MAG TPA: hypothetical protein VHZ51_30725 [Ktedonobacteraceae bacterium]|nr:hypothetical protein [Ktedonobacteraceae bacterium]